MEYSLICLTINRFISWEIVLILILMEYSLMFKGLY